MGAAGGIVAGPHADSEQRRDVALEAGGAWLPAAIDHACNRGMPGPAILQLHDGLEDISIIGEVFF